VLPTASKCRVAQAICSPVRRGVLWLSVAIWSLWAANSAGMGSDATRVTYTGIVDERRFYSQATGKRAPVDCRRTTWTIPACGQCSAH